MSSCTFMYLCVLCYCDASLNSALHVGAKTLHNTQCQLVLSIPILVLFTSKMQVWTFWYIRYYFYVNRHYLVQFLIIDLKQNKRKKVERSADIELLKTSIDNKN